MLLRIALLYILFLPFTYEITCYNGRIDLWQSNQNSNETCTSAKYCGVFQAETKAYQTCYDDPNAPELGCAVSFADTVMCFCNTDKCNTLDKVNQPGLPYLETVECVNVIFGDKPSSCPSNLCFYNYQENLRLNRMCASPTDGFGNFDMPLPYYEDYNIYYFYADACYNITYTTNNSLIWCRCREAKCNTEQPYPITNGNVECAMTGDPSYPDMLNESTMINDTCLGQFCYIKAVEHVSPPSPTGEVEKETTYEKGCISAAEHGKFKLQVGSFHHNNWAWHICRKKFCNLNMTAIKRAIETDGAPQFSGGEIETTTKSSLKVAEHASFWITILLVIGCTRELR